MQITRKPGKQKRFGGTINIGGKIYHVSSYMRRVEVTQDGRSISACVPICPQPYNVENVTLTALQAISA